MPRKMQPGRTARALAVLAMGLVLLPMAAQARVDAVPQTITLPEARERGSATFRYLGVPIYRARLFTPQGAALDWGRDLAIELTYLRPVSSDVLTRSTGDELRRMGAEVRDKAALQRCFRAVRPGDRYVALSDGPNRVRLLLNGEATCQLQQPQITRAFMGIFLSPDSRARGFSRQLRGD